MTNEEKALGFAGYHQSVAWGKYLTIFPKLQSFRMPVYSINKRLKVCAGRNFWLENRIEYSYSLLCNNSDTFKNIIIPHELAHQIVYNLHGEQKRIHCKIWASVMVAYGIPPDIYHTMEKVK